MANNIDELIGTLSPEVRGRAYKAIDVETGRLELPSIGLTRALNGGVGRNTQTLIWGTKSASKTSLTLQTIAKAQEEDNTCAFLDVEKGLDKEWAATLGVDLENLLYVNATSASQVFDASKQLMKGGVDLLVIDSITALLPPAFFDDGELKAFDDTGKIGANAEAMSRGLKMLNEANEKTALVLISQIRMSSSGMYFRSSHTGAQAGDFYSSQIIKLWSTESNDYKIKGQIKAGNRLIEVPIGRKVDYTVEYNKLGPQSRSGSYDFYYDGDMRGIDNFAEIVDLCIEYGIIERGGAWYKYEDEKWQGRDAVVAAVKEDKELFNELKGIILE